MTSYFSQLTYFCLNVRSLIMKSLKLETVQFTTKGQVVIPARVRREFQIEEGTRAAVIVTAEGILLRPITRAYLKGLRGSLAGTGAMKALMADRAAERAR
ncbi:MAG: Looped-hinge helix binding protein AbrB family [Verrucomicrobia bacterium]|nr:Looped-hinge helix binding protein AbrB family [Verrucomicrobiota bacterium]